MDNSHDPAWEEPAAASLGDDLRRLVDQGKALGQAEFAWQKARAAYAGRQAGFIAALAALAAAFATFALVALVVGTLMALTPMLGAWVATAAWSAACCSPH